MPRHPSARRKRVEKTQLGTYIPVGLHEALRDFSEASGIPMARIVEDALRDYLGRKVKHA